MSGPIVVVRMEVMGLSIWERTDTVHVKFHTFITQFTTTTIITTTTIWVLVLLK